MRGTAGITHGQLERMQNNWTGQGSSENILEIITGHKLSMNQQPDGESEERTGKADESNLQNTAAKKRGNDQFSTCTMEKRGLKFQ